MGMRFDEVLKIHVSRISVDNGDVAMNIRKKTRTQPFSECKRYRNGSPNQSYDTWSCWIRSWPLYHGLVRGARGKAHYFAISCKMRKADSLITLRLGKRIPLPHSFDLLSIELD